MFISLVHVILLLMVHSRYKSMQPEAIYICYSCLKCYFSSDKKHWSSNMRYWLWSNSYPFFEVCHTPFNINLCWKTLSIHLFSSSYISITLSILSKKTTKCCRCSNLFSSPFLLPRSFFFFFILTIAKSLVNSVLSNFSLLSVICQSLINFFAIWSPIFASGITVYG